MEILFVLVIIRFWSVAHVVKFIKGKWNGPSSALDKLATARLCAN